MEEGNPCNKPGCDGHYELGEVENCSCHISAPCSQHVNNPLVCTACGYEPDEELE